MKALGVAISTALLFLLVGTKNVSAQSTVCSPDSITGWTITPSQLSLPPGGQITVSVQNFQGIPGATQLYVAVDPKYDASGNFQPIAGAPLIVGGGQNVVLGIPPLTPEGTYSVVIGDLPSNPGGGTLFAPCSSVQTLTITSSVQPPPEGTECLSIGAKCAAFNPGDVPEDMGELTWPLCSTSLTYCKPDSPFFWLGTVTAKGNQQSPCLYDPERDGDKYYCTAGTPGSQDQNCICYQELLDRNITAADLVGLGCPQIQGYVNSAIGCMPYIDINLLAAFFIRWSVGVGGGIALFLISVSAIKIMTTKGDPKRLQDARDTFSAGIAGLIFLLLSIFLIRFASETLLQIL